MLMSKHCTKQPFPSQTVFDEPVTWSSEGSLLLKNLSLVVERIVEEFAIEAISYHGDMDNRPAS